MFWYDEVYGVAFSYINVYEQYGIFRYNFVKTWYDGIFRWTFDMLWTEHVQKQYDNLYQLTPVSPTDIELFSSKLTILIGT